MTRASSVTRSAASLLTSRLAVAGIALAFLGVSTRLLTIEEMAVFAVYNTFCGLLTVVCSLGLLATCVKVLPGLTAPGASALDRAESAHLMRVTLAVYGAGAAVWTAALWLAAGPISQLLLKTPHRATDVRAAALASLCFGFYEASQLLLSGLQRYGRLGRNNVAAALIQRSLSLGLFFVFGLKGYLAGFAAGSLAGAALGLWSIRPAMAARHGETGAEAGTARPPGGWIAYSMPFYLDGYLRHFYMQADQLLVGIFLAPADLSLYFVAKRFIQYCQVLVSSLVDPLGAKVAEMRGADPAAVARAFATSLRYFILLFVPLAIALACLSPFLLLAIGGARYADAAVPLALLFLSLPAFAIFSHAAAFVFALGRPSERLAANLVSMGAQALAILALMPALALAGLALARAAGFAAAALFAQRRVAATIGAGAGSGWAPAVRATLSCAPPTLCMALLIVAPHLAVGRAILMPLYAVPACAVCALWYFHRVLDPSERRQLAAMVPGRSRAARAIRDALDGPADSAPGAAAS